MSDSEPTPLELERAIESDRRAAIRIRKPTRKQSARATTQGVPQHPSSRKERRSKHLQAQRRKELHRAARTKVETMRDEGALLSDQFLVYLELSHYRVPPPGRPLTALEYARITANNTYEDLCRML